MTTQTTTTTKNTPKKGRKKKKKTKRKKTKKMKQCPAPVVRELTGIIMITVTTAGPLVSNSPSQYMHQDAW